ncbi:MAG TPA: fumarylacetoacetate hydrolase family protein, partial [bacterium]|nr:fumarylacetoacetate hydrolase family protein [bacterium]
MIREYKDKPGKVVAVGLNYRDHATEFNMPLPQEPILFIKPSTAVIHDGGLIVYPKGATRVDYEAELGVVIGRDCKRVRAEDAMDFIEGFTCVNDVTERHMQGRDGQWTRAKSFDTFCPIGPVVTDEINPGAVGVRCYLNGEQKQKSHTGNLIFTVEKIIEFVSGVMTLEKG